MSVVTFASDLVRIPSVLGGEGPVAARVAEEMRRLGYQDVGIDSLGNVTGVWTGSRPGSTLLLDGHLDTVDVMPRAAWTRDPFGGEIAEGRIWGRGSSDMKGAVAAMVHGIAGLDRDSFAGRVVVSGSVGEEQIEGAALAVVMARARPDFVAIGEASGLDLVRAGRGRAELAVETRGQPAHASTPDLGVNAVLVMQQVCAEISRLPMPKHPFVGQGVMCLTDIISTPYPAHSVVPSGCRATWERRLLPGETLEGLLAEVRAACARAGAPDAKVTDTEVSLVDTDYTTDSGVAFRQPKWFPPWQLAEDHPLVVRALGGLRAAGQRPGLASYQFCTNAAYSAGVAGVPTIGYGPSTAALAHVVDEYLEIAQLEAAAVGYRAIAAAVLGAVE